MKLTFTITLTGLIALFITFAYNYHLYRKDLAKQALIALKGGKQRKTLSVASFFIISSIIFVSSTVMLVYFDYSYSAFAYTNYCAADLDETNNTCVNPFGNVIYKDIQKALESINPDLGESHSIQALFAYPWLIDTGNEDIKTFENNYSFHNNIVLTKDRTFVIDDTLLLTINRPPSITSININVTVTNLSKKNQAITPFKPLSIFLGEQLLLPTNYSELYITLEPNETQTLDYIIPSDETSLGRVLRIQTSSLTYERSDN